MKKLVFAIVTIFTTGVSAVELEQIKEEFNTRSDYIDLAASVGGYEGICFEGTNYQTEQKEALYIGRFENSKGDITYLPFATEHLFNNSRQPDFVTKLTDTSVRANWSKINQTIKQGLTGADNNLGELNRGPDFTFLYTANNEVDGVYLAVSQYSDCRPGQFCNPPILPRCETFHQNGIAGFTGCLLKNDKTHFKKISDTVLVSKRSAEGWNTSGNNHTIRVGAASYCRWTLVTPQKKVPKRFH